MAGGYSVLWGSFSTLAVLWSEGVKVIPSSGTQWPGKIVRWAGLGNLTPRLPLVAVESPRAV